MKYPWFLVVLLCGCAAQPPVSSAPEQPAAPSAAPAASQPAAENAALEHELANRFLREKLAEHGELLLCSQKAYLACFGIGKSHCLKETAPFRGQCFNAAAARAGELDLGHNDARFGALFISCMVGQHLLDYGAGSNRIAACLDRSHYDQGITAPVLWR